MSPADGIAVLSEDNRLPDLGRRQTATLVANVARLGWARLRRGRAPGAGSLTKATTSPLLAWAPLYAGLGLLGLAGTAAGGFLGTVLGVACLAGGLTAFWTAAAIDRVVPPPRRPDCQLDHLPQRPDAPHVLKPYYCETGLVEYVPGQLWLAQMPLVFYGAQFGARMAVLRANAAGELLIYSPIALDPGLRAALEALGPVRFLLAPNLIHHLFVTQWLDAFPSAEAWAAPNLRQRRPDVVWRGELSGTDPPVPWDRSYADVAILQGHAFHEEVLLFQPASRTLLCCDALESLGYAPDLAALYPRRASRWAVAAGLELLGMRERPTPPTDWKLTVRDVSAVARSASAVLEWDFERIVLAHGRLVERDARATWADAFAFARDAEGA